MLNSWTELIDGDHVLRVRNGNRVSAKAVGAVRLNFKNKYLFLENVYFIPGFTRNLISISKLFKQSFALSFCNNKIIISY